MSKNVFFTVEAAVDHFLRKMYGAAIWEDENPIVFLTGPNHPTTN